MSKASEWARAHRDRPEKQFGRSFALHVTPSGDMGIRLSPGLDATPEEALAATRWIIDTFGDGEPAGVRRWIGKPLVNQGEETP